MSGAAADWNGTEASMGIEEKLPAGFMRMERSSQDDPLVRESWI